MLKTLRRRLGGLTETFVRFPVTVAFLIAAAVLTAISIGGEDGLGRSVMTCAVGAAACAAGQAAYERFFSGVLWRILMTMAGIFVTLLFYLSVRSLPQNGPEILVRPAVAMLALFFAFIWAGVIRSRYGFSESFMAAFKALVQAVFFSGILFLGCVAVIAAVDTLISPVDEDAYMHTANIVFVVIAPLILLSLIPVYPGREDISGASASDEKAALIEKRTGSPKFLEVLLSYIVIPLASVFTLILLIYILLNIGGKFWTDNVLEPMLIAYALTVIIVALLVSRFENRVARLFRLIFPKILIPIALFQVTASVLLLMETGVTYGRYYVILFGVFAVFSGIALSLRPAGKSGAVALALIVLSVVSLVPPVDAFTVSRASQVAALETVLEENGMLINGSIRPKGDIPDDDKTAIITSIQYLTETEELDAVPWLPARFNGYDDTAFYSTFGFHMYTPTQPGPTYVSVYLDRAAVIPVGGYDVIVQMNLPPFDKPAGIETTFELSGSVYAVTTKDSGGTHAMVVTDATGAVLIRFDTNEIYARYADYTADKGVLSLDEATFTAENEYAALKIIVQNAGFVRTPGITDENAQLYVLVKIK
jgi:hypothetical protein